MTTSTTSYVLACVFVSLLIKVIKDAVSARNRGPFPPGPKALPLIGNLLDMPTSYPWLTFSRWAEKWGNLLYVTVMGRHYVILNDMQLGVELLEKRGAKYSCRPTFTMGGELMGWDQALVFLPYGDEVRDTRRLFAQYVGSKGQLDKVVSRYGELEEQETRHFLRLVLDNPDGLITHIRRTAGAIILSMAYGYEAHEGKDSFVSLVEEAMDGFAIATAPGAFLVDLIPSMKHFPAWLPGAGWKRKALKWRKLTEDMLELPYEEVKQKLATGKAKECFVVKNLDYASTPERDRRLRNASGSMYAGGADTTVAALHWFYLAMTLYPDVQKKAQQEIDSVIGNDRLPTFADRPYLPYICAVVSEVLRWRPVAPFLAHRSTEDDVINGYFIPKDSMVMANVWQMVHDPKVYHDPHTFKPERFLKTESHTPEQDPRSVMFGFGRRICPGMNVAEASIFISCAMSLAVFDITKVVKNGVEITPGTGHTSTTVSFPEALVCSVKPRSGRAAALIRASAEH